MKNRSKKAIAAAFAIRAVNTESVPTRASRSGNWGGSGGWGWM